MVDAKIVVTVDGKQYSFPLKQEKNVPNSFDMPPCLPCCFPYLDDFKNVIIFDEGVANLEACIKAKQINLEKTEFLGIEKNEITDISIVSTAKKLTDLSASYNKIKDLTPLKGLMGLRSIDLSYNRIEDLTPLEGLKLERVILDYNKIKDVTPLKKVTSLKRLLLYENQIKDISPLKGLPLENLNCSSNQIENIDVINAMTELKYLYCQSNKIRKVCINNKHLHRLELGYNLIENINFVTELNLEYLRLEYNKIKNITPLIVAIKKGKLKQLRYVSLTGNPLNFNKVRKQLATIKKKHVDIEI